MGYRSVSVVWCLLVKIPRCNGGMRVLILPGQRVRTFDGVCVAAICHRIAISRRQRFQLRLCDIILRLLPESTSPFLFKAVLTLLLPVLFAVVALLIHGAAALATNPRSTPPHVLWTKVSTNWLATMPILMVLAYPTLAKAAFQMFRCVESGEDTSVLLLEASLTCYQPQHLAWALGVGVPLLLLFAVGIPASVFFVLRRNNCEQVMQRWLTASSPRSRTARCSTATRFWSKGTARVPASGRPW